MNQSDRERQDYPVQLSDSIEFSTYCNCRISLGQDALPKFECEFSYENPPEFLTCKSIQRLYFRGAVSGTLEEVTVLLSPIPTQFLALGSVRGFARAALTNCFVTGGAAEFSTVEAEVETIGSWLANRMITSSHGDEPKQLTIAGEISKTYDLDTNLSLSIVVAVRSNFEYLPLEKVELRQQILLKLESRQPMSFQLFGRRLDQICNLLSFLSNCAIPFKNVYAAFVEGGEPHYTQIHSQWKRNSLIGERSHDPYVGFASVQENLQEHFTSWMALHDHMPISIDMFRLLKGTPNLQIEFRLLQTITALEAFHRMLVATQRAPKTPSSGKRWSLDSRLESLSQRYSPWIRELLPMRDCAALARTRNYLAHQSVSLQKNTIDPYNYGFWYRQLELAFEVLLLTELPFQDREVPSRMISQRLASIRAGHFGEWPFLGTSE